MESNGGSAWSKRQLLYAPELFERFPYGLMLVTRDGGQVLSLNRKARDLLLADRRSQESRLTCCELICRRIGPILGGGCLAERAADAGVLLPEVRIDMSAGHVPAAAWVTASPLDPNGDEMLFHLRPGSPDDRRRRNIPHSESGRSTQEASELRITTLGRFKVEKLSESLDGAWLEQRPGQLLKYLVCERRRAVPNDQIAEALWPDAGPAEASSRSRYYVHILRDKLEPGRPNRKPSQFVLARRGGYLLDDENVQIDADEFDQEVRAGLAALLSHGRSAAIPHLERAMDIYKGDFLAEDPYADWTFNERERLRQLAAEALRALVPALAAANQLASAATYCRRLAEMEPFDSDVQRTFIEVCLRRGRRSEAVRHYATLRQRMLRSFGEEPDFELSELAT